MYTKEIAKIFDQVLTLDHERKLLERVYKRISSRLGAGGVNSWLDVACGTGALLNAHDTDAYCMGIDISLAMIEVARSKSAVDYKVADMRHFDLGRTFDLVTCTFDSVNHLLDRADVGSMLAHVRCHMHSESLFIFDVYTREGLKEAVVQSTPQLSVKQRGDCYVWTCVIERASYEIVEMPYSRPDIDVLLQETGFKIDFCDDDGLRIVYGVKRS